MSLLVILIISSHNAACVVLIMQFLLLSIQRHSCKSASLIRLLRILQCVFVVVGIRFILLSSYFLYCYLVCYVHFA